MQAFFSGAGQFQSVSNVMFDSPRKITQRHDRQRYGYANGVGAAYGNRDTVQPREHVCREPLVGEHATKAVPEVPQRLGILQILPMQSLEGLDSGQSRPVDSIDVPHGDWSHDTADAVTEETNRDCTQDDGGGAQRQVVEQVLSCEHLDTSCGIRGGCRRDGAHGVLLQGPGPGIEEMDSRDPFGAVALATFRPPSCLEFVPTREEGSPCLAEKVGDKHDESARNGNRRRFELSAHMSATRRARDIQSTFDIHLQCRSGS